jgi:hypothetical protein
MTRGKGMTNRVRILAVTAALVATAALGTTTGIAKTGHLGAPAAAGAGKQAPAVQAAAKPSGYAIVSAAFSAPNGQQTFGSVACPTTKKGVTRDPLGGGVVISSSSLSANVNSSFPSSTSWDAYVDNNSGSDTSFVVYAVCATPHKHYQVVVSSGVDNPAGSQNTAIAVCPSGTKVTGGGGLTSSFDLAVNINSSLPNGNGWRVDANNAGTGSNTLTSYAVCSSSWPAKTGYNVVTGATVTNAAGTETQATALCASGQSVLGGGGYSGSGSTAVNMNGTVPLGNSWSVYENNASGSDTTINAYAICAT